MGRGEKDKEKQGIRDKVGRRKEDGRDYDRKKVRDEG